MVQRALEVANELKKEAINAEVINIRFLKPLDAENIVKSVIKTKFVVTIEDGTIINGLATAIDEALEKRKISNVKKLHFAYPDKFIRHGSIEELEKIYKLDKWNIIRKIKNKLK